MVINVWSRDHYLTGMEMALHLSINYLAGLVADLIFIEEEILFWVFHFVLILVLKRRKCAVSLARELKGK